LAQSPTTAPSKPNKLGIIVGPDTTFFTSPLKPDGSVDYVAVLNEIEGRGVTPENNAACILMRINDQDFDVDRRATTLHLIGDPVHPGDEITWQNWLGFAHSVPTDDSSNPAHFDRFERAKVQPWSGADIPDLVEWLGSNAKALDVVEQASRRTRFFLPIVPATGVTSTHLSADWAEGLELRTWLEMRDALCIRSMLRLQQGEIDRALDDLLIEARLGVLLSQSQNLVLFLSSALYRNNVAESFWPVLQVSHLPAVCRRRGLRNSQPICLPPVRYPERKSKSGKAAAAISSTASSPLPSSIARIWIGTEC
jgi:hypothetical protein